MSSPAGQEVGNVPAPRPRVSFQQKLSVDCNRRRRNCVSGCADEACAGRRIARDSKSAVNILLALVMIIVKLMTEMISVSCFCSDTVLSSVGQIFVVFDSPLLVRIELWEFCSSMVWLCCLFLVQFKLF